VLTATYLSVFHEVTSIAGGTDRLLAVLTAALLAATVLARRVNERTAGGVGSAILVLGGIWYLLSTPATVGTGFGAVLDALGDTLALATGRPVIEITAVSRWAAATAPAPVFLSWYLAVRRRYTLAAGVGGSMVFFFILTTDLQLAGLVGIVASFCTIGFGELDRRDGTIDQAQRRIVLVAVMTVAALFISVVPASNGSTLSGYGVGGESRGDGTTDIENNLVATDGSLTVQGTVSLSPAVRFSVQADEPARWRVATYDRYTGEGWVRTDGLNPYDEQLDAPAGLSRPNKQRYRLRSPAAVMPAAAQPVAVGEGIRDRTLVTDHGSLVPRTELREDESYTVGSRSPVVSDAVLADADAPPPDSIVDQYTQVPGKTPDRVGALTADLTANASSTYEAAVIVERFLEREKTYSLDVRRPQGTIADSFLFEMEAGYCTYYATTMVTMLRTQGIPARLAVGYNTGQRVGEHEWVVRGSDAHAWVEVYVADVGWVEFDPTPAAGWTDARQGALSDARDGGFLSEDIDTPETTEAPYTGSDGSNASSPTAGDNGTTGDADGPTGSDEGSSGTGAIDRRGPPGLDESAIGSVSATEYRDSGGGVLAVIRSRGVHLALGLVLLFGLLAGVRGTGLVTRVRTSARLYWHRPTTDPERDVTRAAERIELLLAVEFRPRGPTETRQEYCESVPVSDERIHRVFELAARAEYGDSVTETEAGDAVASADELVRESRPLRSVFRNALPVFGMERP
jgi:transglutaminase-like putative cysteine protease